MDLLHLLHRCSGVLLAAAIACCAHLAKSQNLYVHPNPLSHQFEASVAVHPMNAAVALVAASTRSNSLRIGWYYTSDFGRTWTGRDTLPTHADLGRNMLDPDPDIDLAGNLYIAGFYRPDIIVVRSTDGGGTWTQSTVAVPAIPERPQMAIDRTPASPYRDFIYVVYTDLGGSTPNPALFSRSTDLGQTFSPSVSLTGGIGGNAAVGPSLAINREGSLYAIWSGYNSPPWTNPLPFDLGFNVSTDGGATWDTARTLRMITFNGSANGVSFFNFPTIAVDVTSGRWSGNVYIAYAERNPDATDIFLLRSTDRGTTWSDPLQVNTDNQKGRYQWQPSVCVDPASGAIVVAYYDGRNFAGGDSAQVYMSRSTDGGETFTDSLVSDVPFRPTGAANFPIVPEYMGSYMGVASRGDTVWTSWNDNRSGLWLDGKRLHQAYSSRTVYQPTAVETEIYDLPAQFVLGQNYPNPFNPATRIRYQVPQRSELSIMVLDLLGREVARLVDQDRSPGTYEIDFDGRGLSSGVYFCRMTAGTVALTRRMILIR